MTALLDHLKSSALLAEYSVTRTVTTNTNLDMLPISSVAATLGLLSHWLYFIRGEHHLNALRFVKLFFWLPVALCLILTMLLHVTLSHAVQLTASIAAAYLGALWTSMIIYRVFFHRLHGFPGPRLAATSKLYHVCRLGKMDNFRKLAGWHQAYGDFVRIGKPASLLASWARSASACIPALGRPWLRRSRSDRAQWYDHHFISPGSLEGGIIRTEAIPIVLDCWFECWTL